MCTSLNSFCGICKCEINKQNTIPIFCVCVIRTKRSYWCCTSSPNACTKIRNFAEQLRACRAQEAPGRNGGGRWTEMAIQWMEHDISIRRVFLMWERQHIHIAPCLIFHSLNDDPWFGDGRSWRASHYHIFAHTTFPNNTQHDCRCNSVRGIRYIFSGSIMFIYLLFCLVGLATISMFEQWTVFHEHYSHRLWQIHFWKIYSQNGFGAMGNKVFGIVCAMIIIEATANTFVLFFLVLKHTDPSSNVLSYPPSFCSIHVSIAV